jgi:hypothetical protein
MLRKERGRQRSAWIWASVSTNANAGPRHVRPSTAPSISGQKELQANHKAFTQVIHTARAGAQPQRPRVWIGTKSFPSQAACERRAGVCTLTVPSLSTQLLLCWHHQGGLALPKLKRGVWRSTSVVYKGLDLPSNALSYRYHATLLASCGLWLHTHQHCNHNDHRDREHQLSRDQVHAFGSATSRIPSFTLSRRLCVEAHHTKHDQRAMRHVLATDRLRNLLVPPTAATAAATAAPCPHPTAATTLVLLAGELEIASRWRGMTMNRRRTSNDWRRRLDGSVSLAAVGTEHALLSSGPAARARPRPRLLPPPAAPRWLCTTMVTIALTAWELESRVERRPLGIARARAFLKAVDRAASRRGHVFFCFWTRLEVGAR